jgi:hypothetical protein
VSGVRVVSSLGDLERDLREMAPKAKAEFQGVVREAVKVGNTVAKDYARVTSRRHARKYPAAFSSQMNRGGGLFGNTYSGEYGPEARGQGLLANILENGSRNNPPHQNLARSADLIAHALPGEVHGVLDRLFW